MVNLTVGVEYGGVVYAGDRVDNQHVYYPTKFNKKAALALSKGDIVYGDPTDAGKMRLATLGDPGPFFMVYEDTPATALRVHCWHDEGNWLLAYINSSGVLPNTILIPNAGKLVARGTNLTTGGYAIMMGLPDQEAELTAGNVLQSTLASAGLGVVKVMNMVRLPTS
jgi:hypothetical protein